MHEHKQGADGAAGGKMSSCNHTQTDTGTQKHTQTHRHTDTQTHTQTHENKLGVVLPFQARQLISPNMAITSAMAAFVLMVGEGGCPG